MEGCKYCKDNETILERKDIYKITELTQISIEDGHLVLADMFGIMGTEINYCPMCGTKL